MHSRQAAIGYSCEPVGYYLLHKSPTLASAGRFKYTDSALVEVVV